MRAFMEPRMGAVQPWAERHGIGRDTIYALWRGRQPSPATLKLLAEALGVGYDDLLRIRAGIPPADEGDLTRVLIAEQRETRAMLERVLSTLGGASPARDAELESWMARVDERLSTLPTDIDPGRPPGSSPTPTGHRRRRDASS